jgi:hypothetical protein
MNRKNLAIPFLVFVLFMASLACGGTSKSSPTSTAEESAWTACTLFIEKQLDISFLDAQDYSPSGVTALGDGQYEVKVYYAKYSDTYKCTILRRSNGDWQLLDLKVQQ